jgi:hypothetical protein
MKFFLSICLFVVTLNAQALIDSQILTKPNQAYMNFFLEGYLSWHDKNFGMRPDLGNSNGNEFLNEVIKKIDHWRTPDNNQLDQILMGQGFNREGRPYYNFRLYIHEDLRKHSYLKSMNLPFAPLFIEETAEDGICFLGEIKMDDILWKSVPRYHGTFYLKHLCRKDNGKFEMKFISAISQHESGIFKNPFAGQADYEIQTYNADKLTRIFQYVKTSHTAFLLPQHVPYINLHGAETLLPFDKFSINVKGEMVIYYP